MNWEALLLLEDCQVVPVTLVTPPLKSSMPTPGEAAPTPFKVPPVCEKVPAILRVVVSVVADACSVSIPAVCVYAKALMAALPAAEKRSSLVPVDLRENV